MTTPQEIISGLTQRGLPLHVAQGIAGNMYAESGYNPGVNEAAPIVPGSRGGYGLNQWTGPRRRAIEAEASRLGVPVSDVGFQLDYTMQELQGPERRAYDALLATNDPVEAARVYSQMFLRPGIPHLDRRLGEAARLAGVDYAPGVMETATRGQTMPDQQGLLAMLGGGQQQPQQQAGQQRSMWDRAPLGLADPDRRARLAMALEGMTLNPNQQLMTGLREDVQGRREDARTAQARNATAEWLRSQGRADLAAVVEGGGLQGAQAMSLAMEEAARARAGSAPPAAIADVEARANYMGLTGAERDAFIRRELGGAVGAVGAAVSADQLGQLNTIRDDLRTDMGMFTDVQNGYNTVLTFYDNPSGVSDYGLAVSFAKILDPGSVAREGEVAAVQGAAARFPALAQSLRNAITGEGSLTPVMRQQIAGLATQLYTTQAERAQTVLGRYQGLAANAGLDPSMLWMGGEITPPRAIAIPRDQTQGAQTSQASVTEIDPMLQRFVGMSEDQRRSALAAMTPQERAEFRAALEALR